MGVNQYRFTITVSGGTGTIALADRQYVFGKKMRMGIKPPNAAAIYDLLIEDNDSFLVYAENDCVGKTSIPMEGLCNSKINITISGASYDGVYNLRLYSET